MSTGPVVIGYDGSPAAQHALHEAAGLLAPRRALVVVVWEAGKAFEALELGTRNVLDTPPTSLDIRAALEADRAMYEAAEQVAQQGALLAAENGLDAEGLAVADQATVAETLLRVAREVDAEALVVGHKNQSGLKELLLGSTTRDVLKHATCPVVVVRHPRQ